MILQGLLFVIDSVICCLEDVPKSIKSNNSSVLDELLDFIVQTSPEYLMPPSAISLMPLFLHTFATSCIADSCGTPIPATTLVVQIEPGPIPTFTPSAPASIKNFEEGPVHRKDGLCHHATTNQEPYKGQKKKNHLALVIKAQALII